MPYDLTTIASLATVIGLIFGVVSGVMRFLQDYLTAKFGKQDMSVAQQSAQCRFDHETIAAQISNQQREVHALIQNQNEHIARLLQQNGEQLKYMQDASHVHELRHTITIQKLDDILEKVKL